MYAHQIENCSILKINGGEGLAKKERFVSLNTVVDKKKTKKKKTSHPVVQCLLEKLGLEIRFPKWLYARFFATLYATFR